jgi:glucose/arabinose dehydrogenase
MHACAGLLQLLILLLTIGGNPSTANHMTLEVDDEFRASFQESKVMDIPDPTDIEFSPDGNLMLVTTKLGKVWAITNFANDDGDNNSAQKTEVLDMSTRLCTNGERGLGGVAFHPQFGRANHWVYLYYTYENDSDCYADGELGKGPVGCPDLTCQRLHLARMA